MLPANPQQPNQLTQQLHNLPTMSREEILSFFQQDLTSLDPKKIIGNLEMLTMFADPETVKELKAAILKSLHGGNKRIYGLVDYLKRSVGAELMAQIPIGKKDLSKSSGSSLVEDQANQLKKTATVPSPKPAIGRAELASLPKTDYFDFQDAQEVDQFREPRLAGKPKNKYQGHNFKGQLQQVWSILPQETKAQLDKDDLLRRRLESFILTYLKDIRDDLETRQRLAAKPELGGMGFDYELVDKIFAILKPPLSLKPISLDAHKIRRLKDKEKIALQRPIVPQPPKISTPPAPPITITHRNPRPAPSAKKLANTVTDIKRPGHTANRRHPNLVVVNPTEEFSSLSLDDLRRAESPRAFTKSILDKINALSEQNFANKAKAVQAWHMSKIYQQYVEIGQKSLQQNKTVEEYLANNPKNFLTREEFDAIGELNQKLRF
jgi:hypothetical protein